MSGETEERPSGWSTDTLHSHIQTQLRDLKILLDERNGTQQTAMQAALAAAEKAVLKAEVAADKRFECVAADTPVLCADLTWRPAGDLLPGDELIACDETGLTRRGRRYRRAIVTDNSVARDALLLVTTPAGSVRCNYSHPWLAKPAGRNVVWRWVEAQYLQPGDLVHHAVDTWAVDRSWESGWLAGMYDGEGCLSLSHANLQLTLSQRESPTSDLIASSLKGRLGYAPLAYRLEPGGPSTPNNTQPFFHFMVSRRPDIMKILGSVRPPRLLVHADEVWDGQVVGARHRATPVTSVEGCGSGLIARLSTSTHTYLANGFIMHNSVNEFRAQLADQANTFLPRAEAKAILDAIATKVDDLAGRLDRSEGKSTGLNAGWVILGSVVGLALTIIVIYNILRGVTP